MTDSKAGPAGTLETPADVKKKQLFLISIIVIVVMLATFFSTIVGGSTGEPKSPRKEPARKTSIAPPGVRVDPQEAWVGAAGEQIASLERDKRALEDRLQRLEEKEKARDGKQGAPTEGFMPPLGVPPLPVAAQPLAAASATGIPGQGIAAEQAPPPHKIATTMVMGGSAQEQPRGVATDPAPSAGSAQPVAATAVATPTTAAAPAAVDPDLTREDYVPAGSFFRAVMLSGLDAPTGGQVQANPHPVLLRLLDNAILPNRFRAQVKECFIVAAGYGDMSSERAYLRTESLSCVNRKGQIIDVPIAGWAIGDDGKAGIRGRVVSKQGQAIANAILSGVLAGLGSAIKESSVNTVVTGGGLGGGSVVQVPKPGKEFRAGLGEGVTQGLDRLTEYYIKLAERIFPVIEVDAGRVVDVALNKGMSLKGLYKADVGDPAPSSDAGALGRRQLAQRQSVKLPQEQQP